MAIGASARDVQRDILLQTLRLAAMGLGIGTVACWLLIRVIGGLLFGVSPTDLPDGLPASTRWPLCA